MKYESIIPFSTKNTKNKKKIDNSPAPDKECFKLRAIMNRGVLQTSNIKDEI